MVKFFNKSSNSGNERRNLRLKEADRCQFNTVVNDGITKVLKMYASTLGLPLCVIAEHLLEIGIYHMMRISQDQELKNILTRHLIDVHLLGNGKGGDDILLKFGCDKLRLADFAEANFKAYNRLFLLDELVNTAIKTNDTSGIRHSLALSKKECLQALFELKTIYTIVRDDITVLKDKTNPKKNREQYSFK